MNIDSKKKIDLEQVVDELQQTNDFLVEINKNLSKMVAFHQASITGFDRSLFCQRRRLNKQRKNYSLNFHIKC